MGAGQSDTGQRVGQGADSRKEVSENRQLVSKLARLVQDPTDPEPLPASRALVPVARAELVPVATDLTIQSTPTLPEIVDLETERADACARAARAANTYRVYAADWVIFTTWCAERGECPLPASVELVRRFVAWEADRGRSPATIERRLAAIGHYHRAVNLVAPTAQPDAGKLRETIAGSDVPGSECRLWFIDLEPCDLPWPMVAAALSEDELQRSARFHRAEDRRAFLLCRLAVRSLCGKILGIPPRKVPIATDDRTKPYLRGISQLFFNISHATGLGAVAISNGGDVGVDIERAARFAQYDRLARSILTTDELQVFLRMTAPRRSAHLAACWTAKEAFLKAIGTGLQVPMTALAMPPPGFRIVDEAHAAAATSATQQSFHRGHFRGCVWAAVVLSRAAVIPAGVLTLDAGRRAFQVSAVRSNQSPNEGVLSV